MATAQNRRRCLGRFPALLGPVLLTACPPRAPVAPGPTEASGARDTKLVHEACDVTGSAERFDANGDGVPELSRSHRGGRAVCEAFDLNQDGVVDIWAYYDGAGRIRRRELAYSRDARISEVRLYKGGLLAEIQQATGLAGKVDTWQLFANGKRVRTERDSNGDGRIDEWWEYPDPRRPDCPLMYRDENDDGRPEKRHAVDLCASGYVPPERRVFRPTSPKFERQDSLPEEVDKPEGAAAPGEAKGTPKEAVGAQKR